MSSTTKSYLLPHRHSREFCAKSPACNLGPTLHPRQVDKLKRCSVDLLVSKAHAISISIVFPKGIFALTFFCCILGSQSVSRWITAKTRLFPSAEGRDDELFRAFNDSSWLWQACHRFAKTWFRSIYMLSLVWACMFTTICMTG